MIRKTMWAAALAAAAAACPAHAVDGVSTEFGYNDDDVRLWRVGVQWKWQRRWFVGGSGELTGYRDLSAGG